MENDPHERLSNVFPEIGRLTVESETEPLLMMAFYAQRVVDIRKALEVAETGLVYWQQQVDITCAKE